MRTASRRRPLSWVRPQVLTLEERLPLGDGILGLLVGAALLPPHTAPAVITPAQGSGERGVLTPRFEEVTGGFTPPARQEEALAALFGEVRDAGEDWAPLTDPFAPAARRRHDTLVTSPQRQQGPDAAPLLALRAGEERGTARVSAAPAPLTAPTPRTDAVLLATLVGMQASEAPAAGAATPAQEAQVQESFGKLPLYFEQNVGQTDAQVHFFARGHGYGLFLTSTEAVMVLQKPVEAVGDVGGGMLSRPCLEQAMVSDCLGRESMAPAATAQDAQEPPAVVRLQLAGASATPAVTGRDEQPGKVNYFLGNDPAQWHTNVATFGRVEYDDVYPGIDLVYYGHQRQLEYDFVVAPGADPSVIRLNVSGAERLELDAAGDLLIHAGEPGGVSPGVTLRQHKPFVYQTVGGARQEVASRFMLERQEVRFAVGAYDVGRPLVIDPVLSYSTYVGGSRGDYGRAVAVDPATGDALLAGYTVSTDFPTANPLQLNYGGGVSDVFVARLNAAGSALVYSTYLGGSGYDEGLALAVDPARGDALLTGRTESPNFPTAHPLQASNRGYWNVFVARLSASGSALVFSTYLGGSNYDDGFGVAVDPATGDALVTGRTSSTDFPTANPLQAVNRGSSDVFVARLSAAGSALVFSTYLGGSGYEYGYGVAVDPATGDALLTGRTDSPNFPTAHPFQPTYGGNGDAFAARLSASGSALVFSTYLGGSDGDWGYSVAVDPATGDALLAGYTYSTDFPTAQPLQANLRGLNDVFVARLRASGSALVFSTYLGGSDEDFGFGLVVDPVTGDALVTGRTLSTNFPTANALQAANRGREDVFVARLSASGSALVYSTYLGGSSWDSGWGLAVDPATGDALVTGETPSTDFPTANPLQPSNRGFHDAFITRIGSSAVASFYVYPDSGLVTAGVPFDLYVFALDARRFVIPDYAGAIVVFTTDPLGTPWFVYQFRRTDRGVAFFAEGMILRTPGLQEVFVFDVATFTVWGYAAFDVRP